MPGAGFVIPGDLSLPTGGYAYDRHVLARAVSHGLDLTHVALPATYPAPTAATLAQTKHVLASRPAEQPLLIDGLAYGAMPADLVARIRQPIVALVHHPLCLEAGLSAVAAAALRHTETTALTFARAVVVTSHATAQLLATDFAVPADRITVAEPGTERALRATGTGHPISILAVGSIVPRKAYDVLLDAVAALSTTRPWHLTIVGAVRDPLALHAVETRLAATVGDAPLRTRVTLATGVNDAALNALYAATDLFVLPSHYEGYGMVLTEALVRGLPIVTTDGVAAAKALRDVVRIVPAGDAAALRDALAAVIDDEAFRQSMAEASWRAAETLPTWDDTTHIVTDVLKRIAA